MAHLTRLSGWLITPLDPSCRNGLTLSGKKVKERFNELVVGGNRQGLCLGARGSAGIGTAPQRIVL
jgi:hypothetical protein